MLSRKPPMFIYLVLATLVLASFVLVPAITSLGDDPTPTPLPDTATSPSNATTGLSGTPDASPPVATPEASPSAVAARLDDATLRQAGVNELGVIPVLMYHAFTSDRSVDDMWTRHIDDFRGDLQWLYDNDFYVIPVRDLINDTISAPLGKHPVVLTFDDASGRQFQFMEDATGTLVPTPDSAVGVLEAFFSEHPDFGHTAHFGVVPNNCFAGKGAAFNTWTEYCQPKLQWLSDHGYEVGNHTWTHENLYLIDGEEVAEQVGKAAQFIDEHVTGPGNMSTMLTLPFGDAPAAGTDGASYLANGVWWESEEWIIQGMFEVSGGPTYSPSSSWWDPMSITRFNTDQASLDMWFGMFERGEVPQYTSDGNPDIVSIPDPLPVSLQNERDPGLIASAGKNLVEYPKSNAPVSAALPEVLPGVDAVTTEEGVRLRTEPSTSGEIIEELATGTVVTVISDRVASEHFEWWEVELPDGTTGWVVSDFVEAQTP